MKKAFKILVLVAMFCVSGAIFFACESQSQSLKRIETALVKLNEVYALDMSITMDAKMDDQSQTAAVRVKTIEAEESISAFIETTEHGMTNTLYYLDGCMCSDNGGYYRVEQLDFEEFLEDYGMMEMPSDTTILIEDVKLKRKSEKSLTKYTFNLDESALSSLLKSEGFYEDIDCTIAFSIWLDKKDNLKKMGYDIKLTYDDDTVSMKVMFEITAINDKVFIDFPDEAITAFNNFVKVYTINVMPDPYGYGEARVIEGEPIVGTTVTVQASAYQSDYVFLGWYKNDEKVSSDAIYTFTMPAKNVVLTARFGEYIEDYEDSLDGVVKYYDLGNYDDIVYDSGTNKYVVLRGDRVDIYDASMTKQDSIELLIMPTALDVENGILAIGYAGARQLHLYDLSTMTEIKKMQSVVEIFELVLDGDMVIYADKDQYQTLVFYSISTGEIIKKTTPYYYENRLTINRADHIVYVAEIGYSSSVLNYYNSQTGEKLFDSDIILIKYNNNRPLFDGKYVHFDGGVYDKLTGTMISSIDLNRYYNELENFKPSKTIYDVGELAFVFGNDVSYPKVGIYDNSSEEYFYCFDFAISSLTHVGGSKYLARNIAGNYVAIIDLSAVPSGFEGNIPPVIKEAEITEYEGFARLKHFEQYTLSAADDQYVYLLNYTAFTLCVYDSTTFDEVYRERLMMKPTCIDAYDGKLAIGFGECRLFRVYDTTDFTYTTIKAEENVFEIVIYGDNIIYLPLNYQQEMFVYSLSQNELIYNDYLTTHYSPSIAINREDGILYIGAHNSTIGELVYFDLEIFEIIHEFHTGQFIYSAVPVTFDGEFVHYFGKIFDKKTGLIISETNCARQYDTSDYSNIATIFDDNQISIFTAKKGTTSYTVVYNLATKAIIHELALTPTTIQKTPSGYLIFTPQSVTLVTL